jgi:hypothetical protein
VREVNYENYRMAIKLLTQYVCYAMAPDRQEIVKLCEEKSSKLFWTKMRQIFLEYSKILRVLRLITV